LKVFGSEVLDFVVDEAVQIYGGMGYSAESPVERAYRDARINRIFEGTNEINRMLIVDMLLKKALKGELDLLTHAQSVGDELLAIPDFGEASTDPFELAEKHIENFKKAILLVAGSAAKTLMNELAKEQEVLMNIADMTIQTYVAESLFLRAKKLSLGENKQRAELAQKMMTVFNFEASHKIHKAGNEALMSFESGDQLRMMMMGTKRFTKVGPINTKALRREIAEVAIESGKYPF
jgi:hypothetical protein